MLKRILIVDDSEFVRAQLLDCLKIITDNCFK
jgi:hypothetical protein